MSWTSVSGGEVVQVQTFITNTGVAASTSIPNDDTIPQNTEGSQIMTISITPTNSSNQLVITVNGFYSISSDIITTALFQDSTADAIAGTMGYINANTQLDTFTLQHIMTAGTTSSTTFNVRLGAAAGSAWQFLGSVAAGHKLGAAAVGSIVIAEITV